jgi:hypothetical protein
MFGVLIGVVLLVLAAFIPLNATAHIECLRLGYPSHRVTLLMERYCVKRVDQTDVVVPLHEARRLPR